MKKIKILAIALLVVSVALGVASYLLLPDTVTTQLSIGGSSATTMPKILAVLLPTALGAGGAIAHLAQKEPTKKPLLVSAVGILVFVIMLAVNL